MFGNRKLRTITFFDTSIRLPELKKSNTNTPELLSYPSGGIKFSFRGGCAHERQGKGKTPGISLDHSRVLVFAGCGHSDAALRSGCGGWLGAVSPFPDGMREIK